jgi:dTDP-4-amino-4,6-dideoxygalactose transaminase
MTFCATVNTILQVGATPVLADIGEDGNIDARSIKERITPRTRAILPVHVAGLACRMDAIWELARRFNLLVVEDAAHAVGTHYRGFPIGAGNPAAGSRSDAVAFSFYATKNLTTGEGGMVTTHDEKLLERMRILCLHGISQDAWNRYTEKGKWYYEVVECGFKYNLSDIQSAVGIHQLRKQEEFIRRRTGIASRFAEAFSQVEELTPPSDSPESRHCWHLYILRLNLEKLRIARDEFIDELRQRGIGASVHFIPIQLHPAYRDWVSLPRNYCPKALDLYRRIVSLPLYPDLSDEEVDRIIAAVRDTVERNARENISTSNRTVTSQP